MTAAMNGRFRRRMVRALAGGFVLALTVSCVGPATPPPPPAAGQQQGVPVHPTTVTAIPALAGTAANGGPLYAAYCAGCHSFAPAETTLGPSFADLLGRSRETIAAAGYGGAATTAREYVHESIVTPSAYEVEGYASNAMPAYSELLTEQDVADLIAFLIPAS